MGASAARLELVAGKAAGMSIVVGDELLIGRHAEGAGRLADDEEISRSHARLAVDASGFCAIEDLGSTNGTFVNGLRVSTPQTLAEGDTIEVGGTTLVVRELPTLETEPAGQPGERPRQETASQVTPAGAPASGPSALDVDAPAREEPSGLAAVAAAEPSPLAADQSAGPVPPPLSLQLEVDFAAHEARLLMDDNSGPVRLVFDGDAWRSAPSPSIEKGITA
ncbi:MAG: FHA domain-containing protein [Solirubrobacteraceae bacterium]